MEPDQQGRIDERRAAALLGLAPAELRQLSHVSGLGHFEKREEREQIVFTYEELRKLCLLEAPSFD